MTKFQSLEEYGIKTFADLRYELKNAKRREAVSDATGIDRQYLILLRREIESYLPRPFALKDFDWLPKVEIAKLEANGIRDTAALYNAAVSANGIAGLATTVDADTDTIEALYRLVDLTRVQWVSPTAARMLVEAGYNSASRLAAANDEDLCEALTEVNKDSRFFKGNIGLRDIKRLVRAAGYVSN